MRQPAESGGWVELFRGAALEVGMLEDLLRQQEIASFVQADDAMTRLEGSVAWPARYARLFVLEADMQARREEIEEILSVVSVPPDAEEGGGGESSDPALK